MIGPHERKRLERALWRAMDKRFRCVLPDGRRAVLVLVNGQKFWAPISDMSFVQLEQRARACGIDTVAALAP